MDTVCKMREQLVLAERLFDMDITSYPCLGQVESEMKKLQQVRGKQQKRKKEKRLKFEGSIAVPRWKAR